MNMKGINKVAIIGGGIAGMTAAILLGRQNLNVDLIEEKSSLTPIGAGITLSAPTLRVFKEIGILEELEKYGGCFNSVDQYTSQGELLRTIPIFAGIASNNLPGGIGIMRTKLAEILANKMKEYKVNVLLNNSIESMVQSADHVSVTLSDGRQERYDMVIGADGVRSHIRNLLYPEFKGSTFTHQGVWRVVVPRFVDQCSIFFGDEIKTGFTPISSTQCYMFFNDHIEKEEHIPEERLTGLLAEYLSGFGGQIPSIVKLIKDGTITAKDIIFRPLAYHMLEEDWHKNRVVLIGDAIHATTPHLATGAGIAVEGALILSQEIAKDQSLEDAFKNYKRRHYARAKLVVDNSVKLGQYEINHESDEKRGLLMKESYEELSKPIME
ncbi:FAD-binding protein [Acinetobacter wuhouensis]|nr:FAD-binding protein [Acinetobacter wuhouensis]